MGLAQFLRTGLLFASILFSGCTDSGTNQIQPSTGAKSNSESGAGSEIKGSAQSTSFAGTWKEDESEGDYLYVGSGKGFFCASDIKSDSSVVVNGNKLGSAFSPDAMEMSLAENGTVLVVKGEEKGISYETQYKKTSDVLPKRCADEISKL